MTAKTPGQLACETFWAAVRRLHGGEDAGDWPGNAWDWANDRNSREAWHEAAAAVETEQVRLAHQDRDSLRERMLDIATELEGEAASLNATGVTRGNRIRRDAAAKIRKGLDA